MASVNCTLPVVDSSCWSSLWCLSSILFLGWCAVMRPYLKLHLMLQNYITFFTEISYSSLYSSFHYFAYYWQNDNWCACILVFYLLLHYFFFFTISDRVLITALVLFEPNAFRTFSPFVMSFILSSIYGVNWSISSSGRFVIILLTLISKFMVSVLLHENCFTSTDANPDAYLSLLVFRWFATVEKKIEDCFFCQNS